MNIIKGEDLVNNSRQKGNYLYEKLGRLKSHKIVGDIRGGFGLLCAIELVKDKETKARFSKEANLTGKATEILRKYKILGRGGDFIPIAPPLCITYDEIDEFVDTIDFAIKEIEETV